MQFDQLQYQKNADGSHTVKLFNKYILQGEVTFPTEDLAKEYHGFKTGQLAGHSTTTHMPIPKLGGRPAPPLDKPAVPKDLNVREMKSFPIPKPGTPEGKKAAQDAAYRPETPTPPSQTPLNPQAPQTPTRPIAEMKPDVDISARTANQSHAVIDTSAKVGKEQVIDHSARVAPAQTVDVSAKVPGVDLSKPLPIRDFDDEL
jgi:hypothetical protein